LREVLRKINKEVEIIAHPDIWAAKYGRRPGHEARYAGIPFQRRELENLGARFTLTTEPVKITEAVTTTGEIPMVTGYEELNQTLVVKEEDGYRTDLLLDDQAIIINTGQGLVVVLGCAHRGIINTIYHAQNITGEKKINMVLGGCHLIGATEERIRSTIGALKELGVERIGVSHCTGMDAAVVMAQEFGENFFFNNAGTRVEI